MKNMIKVVILLISVLMIFVACSPSSPQDQIKEIDKLMSAEFTLTAEEQGEVDQFTVAGKRFLKEGEAEKASEEFAKALKVLTMAEDAYIFNKAD